MILKKISQMVRNVTPDAIEINDVEVWFQDEARVGQRGTVTCSGRTREHALGSLDSNSLMRLSPYSPELNPVEQVWQQ